MRRNTSILLFIIAAVLLITGCFSKNNGNVKSANNKAKSQQYKNANRDADTKQVKHNKKKTKKKQNFVEENNPRRSTKYEIKNEKSESRLKSLMKKPLKWLSKFGKK